MNNVMRGRWGGGESWHKQWSLLEELEGRHTELGQQIDFSDLTRDVESAFIFDICSPLSSSVRQSIEAAKAEANKVGNDRFGNPISDTEEWNKFHERLRAIISSEDHLFERARTENIAQVILLVAQTAEAALRDGFGVNVSFKDGVIDGLTILTTLVGNRPIVVTPELMSWADNHGAFSD